MNHFEVDPARATEFEEHWRRRHSYLDEVPGVDLIALSSLTNRVAQDAEGPPVTLPDSAGADLSGRVALIDSQRGEADSAASMLVDPAPARRWESEFDAMLSSAVTDAQVGEHLGAVAAEVDGILDAIVAPEPSTLTLTGTAFNPGEHGNSASDVDDSVNMLTNVVAGLTAPIFNGGALFAESRATVADRRAAAAEYVRTTLAAWREVEGAISGDQSLEVRETQFAIAAEEARAAQELAEREYARGVATLFELIDAYTRRIEAERGLITARAARVNNRITYHVALGGGARTGGIDEDRELAP